jgi:hypothetical protein
VIYFVRCDVTGLTKIGFTSRPMAERLATLQVGSPTVLRVVGVREGGFVDEAGAHAFHREKRRHGEWFALSDEDIERENLRPAHEVETTDPPPRRGEWDPARRLRDARKAASRGNARQRAAP